MAQPSPLPASPSTPSTNCSLGLGLTCGKPHPVHSASRPCTWWSPWVDLLTGSGKFGDDERETPPDPGTSPPASTFAKTPLQFPGRCWSAKQRLATGRASQEGCQRSRWPGMHTPNTALSPYWALSPSAESREPGKVGLALPKAQELFHGRIIMALTVVCCSC